MTVAEMVCNCREVNDLRARLAEVEAERDAAREFAAEADAANEGLGKRLAAVLALHYARGRNIHGDEVCNECSPLRPMPCPTVRAATAGDDRD